MRIRYHGKLVSFQQYDYFLICERTIFFELSISSQLWWFISLMVLI